MRVLYLLNASNSSQLAADSGFTFADLLAPALTDAGAQVTVASPVPVGDPRVHFALTTSPSTKCRARFEPGMDDGGLGQSVLLAFTAGLAACDRVLVHSSSAASWATAAAARTGVDLGEKLHIVPAPRDVRLVPDPADIAPPEGRATGIYNHRLYAHYGTARFTRLARRLAADAPVRAAQPKSLIVAPEGLGEGLGPLARSGARIAAGREYRYLQVWKCVPSSNRHCLLSGGAGHCRCVHSDWFVPALCEPEKKAVHLEDLVLESATGESVPVYVPNRGSGRAGRHMWVPSTDCKRWQELIGEKEPLPDAPGEEDDEITFDEQEIDRTCRAGEEGWFVSDARPIRDLGQPTGGFTLPRMPVQPSRNPMLITAIERAAASAALGCPPWELGPCTECRQLMRRYGRDAAMFCGVCRAVLNGR